MLETADRVRHGFPVGQRAAEPAVVHVVLRATLCGFGHRLLGLALGADEEDATALGHGFTNRVQSRVQHGSGLGQVDDVDTVALAVDELCHPRVPTLSLVTEVNASFEQLTHGEIGKRHVLVLSGLRLSGGSGSSYPTGGPKRGCLPRRPASACEVARVYARFPGCATPLPRLLLQVSPRGPARGPGTALLTLPGGRDRRPVWGAAPDPRIFAEQ